MKTEGKWTNFALQVKRMPPAAPDSAIGGDSDCLQMHFQYLLTWTHRDSAFSYCPVVLSGEFDDDVAGCCDVHQQTSRYSDAQFDYPMFAHRQIQTLLLFDCLSSSLPAVVPVDEVQLTELNLPCSKLNLILQPKKHQYSCFHFHSTVAAVADYTCLSNKLP